MSALLASELLKVRTTRGWYAYLVVIVLLAGLAVAAQVGSEGTRRGELDFQLDLVATAGLASLLAIILGITVVTTEFRHGTITPTTLVTPQRERVVAAKAVATLLLSLAFVALALLVVAAVALPWLAAVDAPLHLGQGEVARRTARVVLSAVLWGLIGVAIGALVQSQVAALVGTLIWIFVGETLLVGLFVLLELDGLSAYLPFQALDGADEEGGGDLLSYWPAVGVSLGWIALIGAVGTERVRRRDIT